MKNSVRRGGAAEKGLSQLQRASFRQIRNPSPITASNAYWKERSSGKNEK